MNSEVTVYLNELLDRHLLAETKSIVGCPPELVDTVVFYSI